MMKSLLFVCMIQSLTMVALAQPGSLQDLVRRLPTSDGIKIYRAKEIITLDPAKPKANAVAVIGDWIYGVGTLEELLKQIKDDAATPPQIDERFADQVIVPGFISQHDHPLLAALTMTSEIIAIEDWVLPSGIVPAAKNRDEYLVRLAEADRERSDPNELLLTWGFHHYFHGKLTKSDLDTISSTRPIIVWHRSAHEVIVNTAASKKFGITRELYDTLNASQKQQSNFDEGHYWEQGVFGVLPLLGKAIASPIRLQDGLKFVEAYLHANGVTLGCEPGGVLSKPMQDAQNTQFGDAATPFRYYFIADGKSLTAMYPDDRVIEETRKLNDWGRGNTAILPGQVKLFADGAIFSQAMQMRDGYLDGHQGEWMMDLGFFQRSFRVYWDADYQIHVHVNGDAGLDMVLNTLEENMRRKPRMNHRTVIVHFAVSTPQQVEKIKELKAIVSGNPYYPTVLADNYSKQGLGPERADSMVRLGDVERAGISYSLHSDMPMAPAQPLFLMHCAVNRTTMSGRVAGPNQRISREGALRAVTLNAAYSLKMENDVGSIVRGKRANFTILSENPVTCDAVRIKDINVLGTIHEGRVFPVSKPKQDHSQRQLTPRNEQLAEIKRLNVHYEQRLSRTDSPANGSVSLFGFVDRNEPSICAPGCTCGSGLLKALAAGLSIESTSND